MKQLNVAQPTRKPQKGHLWLGKKMIDTGRGGGRAVRTNVTQKIPTYVRLGNKRKKTTLETS